MLRIGAFKYVLEGLGVIQGLLLVLHHALHSRYLSRNERRMSQHVFCGIVIAQKIDLKNSELVDEAMKYSVEAAKLYTFNLEPKHQKRK